MKTKLISLLFFFLAAVDTSCKKDSQASKPKTTDIYLTGSITNSDRSTTAVYWKNGEIVKLSSASTFAQTTAIAVQNDDVYCLGFTPDNEDTKSSITLWKNGIPLKIDGASNATYPRALIVKGNDVFILADVGVFNGTTSTWTPTVWKNGTPTMLTDGKGYANSSSMAFKGEDLYVAGFTLGANGKQTAVLWKNGTSIKLSDGSTGAAATAITVQGNDVYVAGIGASSKFSVGLVWKNQGTADTLINPLAPYNFTASISAIAVNGSDVYVAGTEADSGSDIKNFGYVSWKNGNRLKTSVVEMSIATLVGTGCFYKNSLYVGGTISGHACYWKDQQPVLLSNIGSSGGNEILIIEH